MLDCQRLAATVALEFLCGIGPKTEFGPFVCPQIISEAEKSIYNSLVPGIHTIFGLIQIPHSASPSTNVLVYLTPPKEYPPAETIQWSAWVAGTNGITTNGVIMLPSEDSRTLNVQIDSAIIGQVMVAAEFLTTNGDLVVAAPFTAFSHPSDGILTNIEVCPSSISMNPGECVPLQLIGEYSTGARVFLYLPSGIAKYSSGDPEIASVDSDGVVMLRSRGTTKISCQYNSFTAEANVTTTPPQSPQLLIVGSSNGMFSFSLFTAPGMTNTIETSTNLNNWQITSQLLPTNILTIWSDDNIGKSPTRFFRAIQRTAPSSPNGTGFSPTISLTNKEQYFRVLPVP